MYSKDELMSKSHDELIGIANELGAKYGKSSTEEEIMYSILDTQAELESSKNPLGTKRKRTRIAKEKQQTAEETKVKNTTEKTTAAKSQGRKKKETPVAESDLFATGAQTGSENMAAETAEAAAATDEAVAATAPTKVDADAKAAAKEMTPEEELASLPKHRGRKTKRELELLAIIEENKNNAALVEAPAAEQPAETEAPTPTAQAEPAATNVQVWEGDPGDGTDFIVVMDVPIEDSQMTPTYDIFDNPINMPVHEKEPEVPVTENVKTYSPTYDFEDLIEVNGVLELLNDGYGFLRSSDYNYLSSPDDVYVTQNMVKKFGLKTGDVIMGKVRPPKDNDKYFTLTSIALINGRNPQEVRDRVPFEHLTPLFPDEKFTLCGDPRTTNLSTRIVDLFSPIGKGQRALIVAQPKTGKTILMKDIANAIAANHPEAYLMMLLIDERPEEVTDMARSVNAEVIASTFDEPAERHVKIAGIVLEKAKRLVECGHDVVIFLDSITRLARAYNTVAPASGKVLTGGVDANALQKPKRFFGAARNIEGGGSLTIIATALIDTGSKMDEVIFEEFKGTGNMELQLDRSLSNKRIFPSVNLVQSSTRRDDLLHDKTTLDRMWILRKHIADMTAMEAMDTIHGLMEKTKDNEEFLISMNG